MALKFNYTVAPHLEEFNLPFPTFRATRPELTHFIGGGLIFSQAAIKTTHHDNPDEEDGVEGEKYPRILLLQRSYEDSWGGHWEGPGGSCEPEDETLLAGVAREIFEESGLHVSRFVELVAIDNWVKTRPDQVIVAAKFTFIVEVHEARSAGSGTGTSTGQHDEEQAGLPADKLEDGGVVPGLSRRWEDAIKLDPAEHRAFEWVTEEEVRDSDGDKAGKFKSFGQQGKTILKAFRMLSEKA